MEENVFENSATLPTTPPPEFLKFIDFLCDPNLTLTDVDSLMGFAPGESKKKIKIYPIF